jgi:hypothetical protein
MHQIDSRLKRHLDAVHRDVRPFVCKICDKAYSYNFYLEKHTR